MKGVSLIYKNIPIYRLMMNALYLGGYRARFQQVISLLKTLSPGARVVELCFGDIFIAEYCRHAGIQWTGIDLNENFVAFARAKKLDARHVDVLTLDRLPECDAIVMIGSLYHFNNVLDSIIKRMCDAAPVMIISEPVKNLSDMKGPIGFLARHAANVGKGEESFRFTRTSFLTSVTTKTSQHGFKIVSVHDFGKDCIIKLTSL